MDALIKKLVDTIEKRNITQKAAALELDVDETTLSRWINRTPPSAKATINRIQQWINHPDSGAYVVVVINGIRYSGTLFPE